MSDQRWTREDANTAGVVSLLGFPSFTTAAVLIAAQPSDRFTLVFLGLATFGAALTFMVSLIALATKPSR